LGIIIYYRHMKCIRRSNPTYIHIIIIIIIITIITIITIIIILSASFYINADANYNDLDNYNKYLFFMKHDINFCSTNEFLCGNYIKNNSNKFYRIFKYS